MSAPRTSLKDLAPPHTRGAQGNSVGSDDSCSGDVRLKNNSLGVGVSDLLSGGRQNRALCAPTLPSRATEDVVADLTQQNSLSLTSPAMQVEAKYAKSSPLSLQLPNAFDSNRNVDLDTEDGFTLEEKDDNVEESPALRALVISERKKRLNAIADGFIQQRTQKLVKHGNLGSPQDDAQQSTRWLVNQLENREIISTPREYQMELFERAKEKNIIAVLDTGSGKTLIAVLLLRHIFAQELEDRALGHSPRISFFIVDSVSLMFQQHAVLKANLDQTMDFFCGAMGCDLWDMASWKKHFENNMVIVCTAEVLRQCLHRSFISMNRINLLIFDEAHHAKKDHAYARIIKDFYAQVPKGTTVPKIFGMTASPVDARIDVNKAAAELEAILHSQICTAEDSSLLQFTVTSKQEQLAKYSPLIPKCKTELYQQLHTRFQLNSILRKPFRYALDATQELGIWCADQVWPFCLSEEELKRLLAKTERAHNMRKDQQPPEVLEKHKNQLIEAQEFVGSYAFGLPDFDPMSESSSNLSSKVVLLVRYLKERFERPTDDKCIVFVRQRYTARILAHLLSHPTIGTPHLHVGTLIGTRTGVAGDLNVSFREQVITMMKFRRGTINCLFATSVAEEGLDIPDCNLVIRFDLYTTLIQYIQSRGRARYVNSRYVHMCEDGNQEHAQMITEARRNEGILKRFCAALPEDRKLKGNDFDMDHFLAHERSHRVYVIKSTGAKLTYKMSLMIVANFVDSLPTGPDKNFQAEYIVQSRGKQFCCEVILPESSPIRGCVGREATTKQVAKCSAAFEICLLLIKGKYLDEYLRPIFTKQLPAMRNALLAVDSKKRADYDMRTKPKIWTAIGIPKQMFLTILLLENPKALDRPSQPLALVTRSKLPQLPSFRLHFSGCKHSVVHSIPLTTPLLVSTAILAKMNTFTLVLFDDVFSKQYESDPAKMPYFLVPILPQIELSTAHDPFELVSWDILESVETHSAAWATDPWENRAWQVEPDEFFKDKYIVDPYDGSRKLWSLGIASQYTPLDPVPENTFPRKNTRKSDLNILESSISLWPKARERRNFDPTQRVFKTELISLRRNLLDEFDSTEVESPKTAFLTFECLRVSTLPTSTVAMAYTFPAIIHRIESYMISLEACELLHLEIRPDLALEACTKDSDNTNDKGTEQINFQRGMGNNYERLEFLGDCFLKMATSISLYGLHPDNDEYRYHVDRMLLICNKNLCSNAIKLKLYEYIRSVSFNRRSWYPEGLVLTKGKKVAGPNTHKLGDKTIADVCEALIGAALLNFHETKQMDNAVRAVTELVSSVNHTATCWADYYRLYTMPKYQTTAATEMQKDLAMKVEKKHDYHFNYPRLLRSAFIHPSYPFSYESIPSYQRLEFLGDSLLDMVCVNYLYHTFPDKDPQWLTEHKMAMVSNQFLGVLCVTLGFNTHMTSLNTQFQSQIRNYVDEVDLACRNAVDDAVRAGLSPSDFSPDYWVSVRQPPKCLPDIVEAFIGAIFVDSQYDFSEVERFFDQHIKCFFNDMAIYDSFANMHPTTFLTHFLQENMGCADWSIMSREVKTIDGSKPTIVAMVVVHSQVISDYCAESSRDAKVGCAQKAFEILKGLPLTEFRINYKCDCSVDGCENLAEQIHGTAI